MAAAFIPWLKQALGLRVGMFHMYAPRPLELPAPAALPAVALPSISLVTPVRNQAQYIAQAIDSVLSQGYPALEYVVLDGASTDGTAQVVESYRPRLAWCESRPDGGQSDAINKGFARTRGEVMGWLNGDDLLLPGALARVGEYFARHPEVDAVYGDRIVIDEQGRDVGRWVLPAHSDGVMSWCDFVPQETLFWRRALWERSGARIDVSFRFAMDWDLLVRFRDAGARFVHLPHFLGAFRVHAQQKTTAEIGAVGFAEMARIRQRCIGRVPSRAEIALAAAPYLARQMLADVRARLRGGRASAQGRPVE